MGRPQGGDPVDPLVSCQPWLFGVLAYVRQHLKGQRVVHRGLTDLQMHNNAVVIALLLGRHRLFPWRRWLSCGWQRFALLQ